MCRPCKSWGTGQAGFLTFGSSCMGLILNNYAATDSRGLTVIWRVDSSSSQADADKSRSCTLCSSSNRVVPGQILGSPWPPVPPRLCRHCHDIQVTAYPLVFFSLRKQAGRSREFFHEGLTRSSWRGCTEQSLLRSWRFSEAKGPIWLRKGRGTSCCRSCASALRKKLFWAD